MRVKLTGIRSALLQTPPWKQLTVDESQQFRMLIYGRGTARTISLAGTRWTIGRSEECTITLEDPTVSRRHLVLERDGDSFTFRDLGSSNLPVVAGRPRSSGRLDCGEELALGMSRLMIEARNRPHPVQATSGETVVLAREVLEGDASPADTQPADTGAMSKALDSFARAFGSLSAPEHAAAPLLELALDLTGHQRGWLALLPRPDRLEMLASISPSTEEADSSLPEGALNDARRLGHPYLLRTDEGGRDRERLLAPLGIDLEGLLVLELPLPNAPRGQALLHLAKTLGLLVWRRLTESKEHQLLQDKLDSAAFHGTDPHQALLTSTRLQRARAQLRSRSADRRGVVLEGEPGTETEELARLLHSDSVRHGATFTRWRRAEPELALDANGGTLFVDAQTPLQPAEQEHVAALMAQHPSWRLVIATTNAASITCPELRAAVEPEPITIPALRTAPRDVTALAELFLAQLGPNQDGAPRLLGERARRLLTSHDWPGNVHELRTTVEAAAVRAGSQPIAPRHLPLAQDPSGDAPEASIPPLEEVERRHIEEVLRRTGGVRSRAAKILGIANSTLYEKLKRYRIQD